MDQSTLERQPCPICDSTEFACERLDNQAGFAPRIRVQDKARLMIDPRIAATPRRSLNRNLCHGDNGFGEITHSPGFSKRACRRSIRA